MAVVLSLTTVRGNLYHHRDRSVIPSGLLPELNGVFKSDPTLVHQRTCRGEGTGQVLGEKEG